MIETVIGMLVALFGFGTTVVIGLSVALWQLSSFNFINSVIIVFIGLNVIMLTMTGLISFISFVRNKKVTQVA